ncbi:DNA cytosine methyltransferase [Ectopseudomonas guguanensis]|uniref:DNA cytosine methyltransferase n=1 Tax=Ectopseudomonas guguanensis TaxID=1198456 RepID=UPI0028ADD6BE|nr:DNA cytosine methyltransferase [Pseudomonas guguanensis]
MPAYYNEIDPYAAQWLRNLIAGGHIAPGDVDERSIQDVHPDDLKPYTQCHFFAGIGVWSLALRRAGWPDDRPVWTGSCPCQPFSSAGQGAGFDDERHLWPDFHWLIQERRPAVVFGEQVASKDAEPWLDLVQTDLEAMAYAFGAVPFPAAGVCAPHIRDRLYWVADANVQRKRTAGNGTRIGDAGWSRATGRVDNVHIAGLAGHGMLAENSSEHSVRSKAGSVGASGIDCRMADAYSAECKTRDVLSGSASEGGERRVDALLHGGDSGWTGPTNGLWGAADWLLCRDGKWRPVEPGTFPLAHGAPARVGRLRAYGNAINLEAAAQFIAAWLEATQ